MSRVRLEKKGIRALGIAESFRKGFGLRSVLGGVVMRSDRIIDGFAFGFPRIGGDDATDEILGMYRRLDRSDINVILLGGVVISLYNIIDPDRVWGETGTPVICVTFEESGGLEDHIRRHFPRRWRGKLDAYRRLGGREKVRLKTGYGVYVRTCGLDTDQARRTLDKFTVQGAVPEPLRLARLMAKAKLDQDIEARVKRAMRHSSP